MNRSESQDGRCLLILETLAMSEMVAGWRVIGQCLCLGCFERASPHLPIMMQNSVEKLAVPLFDRWIQLAVNQVQGSDASPISCHHLLCFRGLDICKSILFHAHTHTNTVSVTASHKTTVKTQILLCSVSIVLSSVHLTLLHIMLNMTGEFQGLIWVPCNMCRILWLSTPSCKGRE